MKTTVKVRNSLLCPTVAYGNITLEAEVEIEGEEDGSILLHQAHQQVMDSLQDQRKVIDELESNFFKVKL